MRVTHSTRAGIQLAGGALLLIVFSFVPFHRLAPTHAQGIGGGGETPYGGMRTLTIECTCTNNELLTIQDYRTKSVLNLVYQPGASILYSNYNIYGIYLLGTYGSGGQCKIYVGKSCVKLESDGQLGNQPGSGTS